MTVGFEKATGRRVLGQTADLPALVHRHDASLVLFAIANVPDIERRRILDRCRETGARVVLIGAGKVSACVAGGATRAGSVRAGMGEVPEGALVVLVHDAARPVLPEAVVERVLAPLGEGWDGAAPALPVADTLKRAADDGSVRETVDRSGLYAVQTPQAFVAPVLREALAGDLDASDCAALVERRSGRVKLVERDPSLLKVTTAADLAFIESLLR